MKPSTQSDTQGASEKPQPQEEVGGKQVDKLSEGYIKVQLDYAPATNGKKFDKWCDKYGFSPLNSGRRAWCGSLSTYLRGAAGVAFNDGEMFLFYAEDVVNDLQPSDDVPSQDNGHSEAQGTQSDKELEDLLIIEFGFKKNDLVFKKLVRMLSRHIAEETNAAYRKGYNDNARDCTCDKLPIAPHHHLMTDGESHNIRPDIATLKANKDKP